MIPIPEVIKYKLVELDRELQLLGRQLYGKKLMAEYQDSQDFQNFSLELHLDGSFTLHFKKQILGSVDQKFFGKDAAGHADILSEINLLMAVVKNQLQLVSI